MSYGTVGTDILLPFPSIWAIDFEFVSLPGEPPDPVCLVARELRSGSLIRLWRDELQRPTPPFPIDESSLIVAYYAAAELGCFQALGWRMPARILDLFTEFRTLTNGLPVYRGNGLLGALFAHGLEAMSESEKARMRGLILKGGPWGPEERMAILDYCQADVDALGRLLPAMLSQIGLPLALLRGRYMAAVAMMEHAGVPLDTELWARIRKDWGVLKAGLVERIDKGFGVYEGPSFRINRFEQYLEDNGIPWPRLPSGQIDLKDNTFKELCRAHPKLEPLRMLRRTLSQMRLADLTVGSDGRNRCMLSAFRSKTGRNQPSNAKFIFGLPTWFRGLIKPPPGYGLAYIDWSCQEIGIAAALSGDPRLIDACRSGDPYLAFAKEVGAVPADATKATHGPERERFKACVLGVNYGMGEQTLANSIGCPTIDARQLLQLHRQTYPQFWHWSNAAVDHAMLYGYLQTVFGWTLHVGREANPRSLMNFPMQANGAEMLRLACCLGTERGIEICAPVHDAVLICAPLETLEEQVAVMRAAMAEASRIVLDGFELRTDAVLVRWPERYADPRGASMWATVMELLEMSRETA